MIIATDVQYDEKTGSALAAAVAFDRWDANHAKAEWTVKVSPIAPYQPGSFYKRELPCLTALLAVAPVSYNIVVVDGHVWLAEGQRGLGHYLYEALDKKVQVIGVAKRHFINGMASEVLRGESQNPLHVTSIGLNVAIACDRIQSMHGPYRIPTLLKRADTLARGYTLTAGVGYKLPPSA